MEERSSYWPLDANPAVCQVMLLNGREDKTFSGKGQHLFGSEFAYLVCFISSTRDCTIVQGGQALHCQTVPVLFAFL